MNEGSPAPALQSLFTDAEVFKPALVEKTEIAVRVRTVQKRRSGINDAPQFLGSCCGKPGCIACRHIGLASGNNCRTRAPIGHGFLGGVEPQWVDRWPFGSYTVSNPGRSLLF